jgi:hypothetical protein
VVLLVLAIVWGVLLVSWLRSRTEGTFSDSVVTFRRHLTVLERATPATVAPANRLRTGPIAGRSRSAHRSPARPGAATRSGSTIHPVSGGLRPPSAARLRRRQVQKRRRDVFFALLAAVVGTFLLCIIPGLSLLWPVQAALDLVFVGYVALLIRLRNLAAERELKLTFLPQQSRSPRRPRSRPAYDLGRAGYGEMALRRAAN